MNRKQRILKKRYAIFCEGDTEYNYIEKMRKNQGVELVLKSINMHGGGYSNFLKLLEYCRIQNDKGNAPIFVVADNPDFEYIACLHDEEYKGQDTKNYIVKTWGYKNLDAFKNDKDVYEFLYSRSNLIAVYNLHRGICLLTKILCHSANIFVIRYKYR